MERHGERFLKRIFSKEERAYCDRKRMKQEHYAARFAAKEAFMKAVEVKRKDRYAFSAIEIRRRPTGKPYIYLTPQNRLRFGVSRKSQIELSMAHERDYAIATVLIAKS